ncbi:glutamine amidotransferase [Leuconostoc gelidum subsp. aenigmaticum]|uniref:type 1 glutamine amidotransferase family protein n=1 Tax=Leuconostoc gelidum TaxID=1244 RepID=UPI001CC45DCC|nr:type 1 glutamine amidotransferase family protein [Leuconostoc gelidum]MBZ6002748.1 glutamine amidotransferase [Leuconostoc gelidum subsp. aenigmaticum]
MKQAVFVVLDEYADWEGAYLSSMLNQTDDWEIKTASIKEHVSSIGGFCTVTDLNLDQISDDVDLLILIGGNSWNIADKKLKKLVKQRLVNNQPIGAICGAVDYLAKNGLLNNYKHTGNASYLWDEFDDYKNKQNFIEKQAVRDHNLVTANGTAALEFTSEVLKMIHFKDADAIERQVALQELGFYKYCMKYGNPFV